MTEIFEQEKCELKEIFRGVGWKNAIFDQQADEKLDKELDKFLVAILYFSGARPDELIRLKKESIVEREGKLDNLAEKKNDSYNDIILRLLRKAC